MAQKRISPSRGKKRTGPIPTPVLEEDIIVPPRPPRWKVVAAGIWEHRKLLGAVFGSLVLVFWGIPAGCRAAVDYVETRQSDRLARMATEYFSKGDRESALMSAKTSLRLAPQNADALRLLAQILGAEGRVAETLEIYQKLGETGKATMPEFKEYAVTASKAGYTSIADWIGGWVAKQGEPEFPHLMRATTLESEGRMPEALAEYRLALQTARNDNTKRALARFLLASSDLGESNAEVFLLLDDISKNNGEGGHEALMIGLLSGVVPAPDRPAWLARLRAHPVANEQSFAIADAIEVDADPAAKPRVVAAMLERVYGKSLEERLLAARWLLRHGEAAQIEKILPLNQARSRPDSLALWMESQAALGNWQAVLEATSANPQGFAPGPLRLLRGQALKKTGRLAEAREEYRLALSECGSDPALLLPALAFLQSDGETEIFRQNTQPLLAGEATALQAVQQLAPAIQQSGDARELREFLQFAADSGPLGTYSVLLNEMAYLDLVLGNPVPQTALEERAANFPDNPAFRFTLALSQLRQGGKAEALVTAGVKKLRVRDLPPQHQLIVACILAANGQTEKATRICQILQVAPLTRQERELLAKYLP